MKNDLFDEASLAIILAPENWRLTGSLFDADARPVRDSVHAAWMKEHHDRHPAREILLALKGNGVYGFRNRVYPCRPGSVFLFDSYEDHDNYYPPFCKEMMHLWLHILENDVFARLIHVKAGKLKILQNQIVFSGDQAMNLLTATWSSLADSSAQPQAFKRAKLISVLSTAFLRIVEYGLGSDAGKPPGNFQSRIIRSIQGHIARTAGRDVPLSEAARLAGYSKFHFLRMFKEETGQTFHEYVNICRLKQVRIMTEANQTKTAIARRLGFSHASALLRWMKSMKKDL